MRLSEPSSTATWLHTSEPRPPADEKCVLVTCCCSAIRWQRLLGSMTRLAEESFAADLRHLAELILEALALVFQNLEGLGLDFRSVVLVGRRAHRFLQNTV